MPRDTSSIVSVNGRYNGYRLQQQYTALRAPLSRVLLCNHSTQVCIHEALLLHYDALLLHYTHSSALHVSTLHRPWYTYYHL
jgi:hypothetical protein